MRVLFLAPTLPWPLDAGGRLRSYHLLRELSREHEIDLWVVERPGSDDRDEASLRSFTGDLRVFPRSRAPRLHALSGPKPESWFHSAELAAALARVQPGEYDLIHLDELCLVRALPADLPTPLLVHHHKLDLELAAAILPTGPRRDLELRRWRLLEDLAVKRTPHQLFCCEEDARLFAARHPHCRAPAVPSGVDLEHFRPRTTARDEEHLLVLGSLDYEPNARGLEAFLASCWSELRERRPALRLSIVGRGPDPARWRDLPAGVVLVGPVEDVRPWLARATALVVPLEIGGGTRLKLVEAAAMECPVVTTEVGASGLRFEGGRHDLRADSIPGLLAPLEEALACASTRAGRAREARELVERDYGWGALAPGVSHAWQAARWPHQAHAAC